MQILRTNSRDSERDSHARPWYHISSPQNPNSSLTRSTKPPLSMRAISLCPSSFSPSRSSAGLSRYSHLCIHVLTESVPAAIIRFHLPDSECNPTRCTASPVSRLSNNNPTEVNAMPNTFTSMPAHRSPAAPPSQTWLPTRIPSLAPRRDTPRAATSLRRTPCKISANNHVIF